MHEMLCRHAYQCSGYLCCGARQWEQMSPILTEKSGLFNQETSLQGKSAPDHASNQALTWSNRNSQHQRLGVFQWPT